MHRFGLGRRNSLILIAALTAAAIITFNMVGLRPDLSSQVSPAVRELRSCPTSVVLVDSSSIYSAEFTKMFYRYVLARDPQAVTFIDTQSVNHSFVGAKILNDADGTSVNPQQLAPSDPSSPTWRRIELTHADLHVASSLITRSSPVYVVVMSKNVSDDWLVGYLRFLDPSLLTDLNNPMSLAEKLADKLALATVVVILEEYLQESLVHLGQKLCWKLDDLVSLPMEELRLQQTALAGAAATTSAQAKSAVVTSSAYSQIKRMIYGHYNQSLHDFMAEKVDFAFHVGMLNKAISQRSEDCNVYTDAAHAARCLLYTLNLSELKARFTQLAGTRTGTFAHSTTTTSAPTTSSVVTIGRGDIGRLLGTAKKQPGKTFPSTCELRRPFVWIRTHRTKNSIFMNVLGRVVWNYDLNTALPISGVFIGWPYPEGIERNYKPRFTGNNTLDAMCCGTFAYNQKIIDKLAPKAIIMSVLRDPVDQFLSGWDTLQMPNMLRDTNKREVTMMDYLREPTKFQQALNEIQNYLMNDIVAGDFGLRFDAKEKDVDAVIKDLDSNPSLILITEYLYESMVLLKRKLCLETEDIIFIDHRLTQPTPSPADSAKRERLAKDPEVRRLIEAVHWKSTKIYKHFRKLFEEEIARQSADFAEEVAQLKEFVAVASRKCHKREKFRGDSPPDVETLAQDDSNGACDLMSLNDLSFSKLMGRRKGNRPISSLTAVIPRAKDDPMCKDRDKEKRIVWIKTHKTGSSTLTNMFHRFGYLHGLSLALPKDDMYYGWPYTGVRNAITFPDNRDPATVKFDMLCSGHSVYERQAMDLLVPGAKYVTLLRNPATHLPSSWTFFEVYKRLTNEKGEPLTVQGFLEKPDYYKPLAPYGDQKLIHNGMAFDLGIDPDDQSEEAIEEAIEMLADPVTGFSMVLITEYMDESLVIMRHKFCWEMEDIMIYSLKVNRPSSGLAPQHIASLREFNKLDVAIYNHFNKTLWEEAAKIPNFQQEVDQYRILRASLVEKCKQIPDVSDRRKRFVLLTEPQASAKFECAALTLDSVEFSRVFKKVNKLAKHDCVAFYPIDTMIYIKPHDMGPMGDIFTNLLYRRAWNNKLPVALPGADMDAANFTKAFTVFTMNEKRKTADILADGHLHFHPDKYTRPSGRFVSNAYGPFFGTLPDPVERFLLAWQTHGMAAKLAAKKLPSTIKEALQDKNAETHKLLEPLRNAISKSFDAVRPNGAPDLENMGLLGQSHLFSFVAPEMADLDTILAYFGRVSCWDFRELAYIRSINRVTPDISTIDSATVAAIRAYNDIDVRLQEHFINNFKGKLGSEVDMEEDVRRIKNARTELLEKCAAYESQSQEKLIENLLKTKDPVEKDCSLVYMEPQSFETLFRKAYKYSQHYNMASFDTA